MDRMEKEPLIQEYRRLPDVADVDGLVSFMGRLMDGQESFYFDLLLASLVRLHPYIKSDDAERMVPVFESANTTVESVLTIATSCPAAKTPLTFPSSSLQKLFSFPLRGSSSKILLFISTR